MFECSGSVLELAGTYLDSAAEPVAKHTAIPKSVNELNFSLLRQSVIGCFSS